MADPGTGIDVRRVAQLAELRDAIAGLPVTARQVLKVGPLEEPLCGVCSAVGGYIGVAQIRDYHDVGVLHWAELLGEEDLERLDAMMPEAAMPLLRALAGALAAERSLVIYLLAGWAPPRVRRPPADRGRWPLPDDAPGSQGGAQPQEAAQQ